ncbi:MAG: hypothetical protein BroJett012_08600 [Betaproteobacteria bacterium]|nr:MAG: hypothetical protein BroJett012_08600 [Betaproteobacteria bacterium]
MAKNAKTKQENPNENCLAGMACPRCGDFGPFKIHVTQSGMAEVADDGTDFAGGDTEWDDDSACRCLACGHEATVRQFSGEDDLPGEPGRTVKTPREIIEDLLEYAVKFAEQNDEPADGGCWDAVEAARAWLRASPTDQGAALLEARQAGFDAGWRTAANWGERDDLIADIGSPAYIADRNAALLDISGKPGASRNG